MDQPYNAITCLANVFIKQMHFRKAGDTEQGHAHCFDHTTLVGAGAVDITVRGKTTRFTAPHMVYIKAGEVHELTAVEDNTVCYCIHALRDGDGVGDILDPASVPEGVNPQALSKSLLISD